jgi:hypothetical protein
MPDRCGGGGALEPAGRARMPLNLKGDSLITDRLLESPFSIYANRLPTQGSGAGGCCGREPDFRVAFE